MRIKKIGHILTGWGKALGFISVSKAEEKMSLARLKSCEDCEVSESKKLLELVNGKADYSDTLLCTICKCPCKEKSLVIDENCPIGRW